MKWKKLGLVFDIAKQGPDWAVGGALTPTPILLNENVIRVFCGFRDGNGISRIGYVDVNVNDPTDILGVSEKPCFDLGTKGSFDDNGQIMGHIIQINGTYHLYYVGFQLVNNVKFLAFTGLAVSEDLKDFRRTSTVPILDRSPEGLFINAIHSLIPYKDGYLVYFASGNEWVEIEGRQYPCYEIYETFTNDGKIFSDERKLVVGCDRKINEYRIGRPSAFLYKGIMHMFFTKGSTTGRDYFPGYAYRDENGSWQRNDDYLGLSLGPDFFDSIHLCYPRFIQTKNKAFIFYNGNFMGASGFAVAELLND